MKRERIVWMLVTLLLISYSVLHGQSGKPTVLRQATTPCGRYQMFFSPLARADEYLIDTETGTIWRATEFTNIKGHPEVWIVQPRTDSKAELEAWELKQTPEDRDVLTQTPPTQTTPAKVIDWSQYTSKPEKSDSPHK